MKLSTAAALLVATALTASAQAPTSKGLNFYSIEKEIEIGKQVAANLEKSLPIVHEPRLDAYIARLGANLAEHSDQRFANRFQFYDARHSPPLLPLPAMVFPMDIFKGKPAEPVGVAGGPIFVPLSFLADADSEGEFAAQLAHAMAHIALRHASRVASRGRLIAYSIPAENQGPAATPVGFLTFARQFELQADQVAVGTIAEAGYDPAVIVRYLEQHRPSNSNQIPQAFSAHPTLIKRLETVQAAIRELPAREYSASTGEFDEISVLAKNVP